MCYFSICNFVFPLFCLFYFILDCLIFKNPLIGFYFPLFSVWCRIYKMPVIALVYFRIIYNFFCCIKPLKLPFSFSPFVLFFNHMTPLYNINYITHYFAFVIFIKDLAKTMPSCVFCLPIFIVSYIYVWTKFSIFLISKFLFEVAKCFLMQVCWQWSL